jgi:calcineurin-like phosphoesterase family protein
VAVALSFMVVGCGSSKEKRADRVSPRRASTTIEAPTGGESTSPPDSTTVSDPSRDPVIAAAGDIACPSECTPTETVAHMLVAGSYAAVLTLGDNQYEDGSLSEYKRSYDPTWGRVKDRTFPSPGNHDYHDRDGAGYYSYFGSRAGPPGKGYYSFEIGTWHLLSLNSEANIDAQLAWVEADLAANQSRCTLAYWHKPIWTSGEKHRDDGKPMRPIWDALAGGGADVVLNGHVHNYERFAPRAGIREFIVGTGGRDSHYEFAATARLSEVRDNSTDGLLRLTLHPGGYDWRFLPVPGGTFTDTGSGSCR